MKRTLLASALALIGATAFCGSASAARITLINGDAGTLVGLNDPTPAAPFGGNPGKTIGEQRRLTYQYAMDMWGSVLESDVEIKVWASFARLTCSPTGSVTLGQAGTTYVVYNFPGATENTLYHSSLGDAIAGEDLAPDPANGDIFSQFNGDLGKADCRADLGWAYGLDGTTPAGKINFLNVVMHEIGHGLGVSGFLNKTTGVLGLGSGLTDVYTHNAYDNVQNLRFDDPAMTNALRATAMKTPGRTVWQGYQVNAQAPLVLGLGTTSLQVTGPAAAAGNYDVAYASFGPKATTSNFPSTALVVANDGVGAMTDGCEPIVNATDIAGKVAVIDRGTCPFSVKVKNAQNAGAAGVVIVNTIDGPFGIGGADPTVTIPSVMVWQTDGNLIKANSPVTGGLNTNPAQLQGADVNNRTRLYSPTFVAGGSTFSHFDTALTPNALMEPFDTPEVQSQIDVDLTPALFADIGWTLNPGNATIAGCDTTVDAVEVGGLIPGASLSAYSNMCSATARGSRASYLRCVSDQATKLQQMGAITSTQNMKVRQCASLVRP